VIPSPVKIISV